MGTSTIDFSKYEEKPQIDFSKYEPAPVSGGKTEGRNLEPPKEGFLHSLASTSGIPTSVDELKQMAAEKKSHAASMLKSGASPLNPFSWFMPTVEESAPAIAQGAKKTGREASSVVDALRRGDFGRAAAHTAGTLGYGVSTVLTPVGGTALQKAGEQFGSGDIGGGLGTTAAIVAPIMVGGRVMGREPIEAPNVFEGEPPTEIPTGRPQGSRNVAAVTPLLAREVTGRIPLVNRMAALKKPTIQEYFTALRRTGETERPTLSASVSETRGPYRPYEGDLTIKPAGEAPAAPPAAEQPTTSQTSTLPRIQSGEGYLNQALTSLDSKTLLKIARSRGIDVTREAQLKPELATRGAIKKIIDDFKPEELDEIQGKGQQAELNKPAPGQEVTPQAGKEAWRYKVLKTYFPDVDIPKAMESRAVATIAKRPTNPLQAAFEAKRAQAEGAANAVPVDDLQGGHAGGGVSSIEELNRPGVNYIVSKSGQLTYHGKAFAPETTPGGATHVTVLSDGTFRVNNGMPLNAAQTSALRFALKKQPWIMQAAKTAKAGDD